MKKSTLALVFAMLAFSNGICIAQESTQRKAVPVPMPYPSGPTLGCCTCVNGMSVPPPPLDISTGIAPWTVNPGGPSAFAISSATPGWVPLAPAKWVQSVNAPSPAPAGPGPFHYATSFTVPQCKIAFSSLQLSGTYAADNAAVVTLPPNTSTCSGPLANPYCFKAPGMPLSWPVAVTPSLQILKVDVTNQPGTIAGLIVNAKVTARCPVCWVPINNLPMQGGNENTPCPALQQVYTRAQAMSAPATAYVHIMLPNLDMQCATKGPGFKAQQITFLTCAPDKRGPGFGPNATANLSCGQ